MASDTGASANPLAGVHPPRLFLGSCIALISTSVAFAVVGGSMFALKAEFRLTNEAVGWIGGAAIWGFTLSIFALGPLCDALGMGRLLGFAFVCHLVGPLLMIFSPMLADSPATGFWVLFFGALIIALGNGTVEAACNPLVATIYPDQKTKKLNQFHVWFPGGIVIGGVLSYLLDQMGLGWQYKIGLIIVPTIVYGILFIGQKFPATERVQSGITFGGMVAHTFGRPLFWVLLLCMAITASLELGPGRWIPAVLEAGGIAGILVLAYINGLMAVLRYFAGSVVHRLSNTGLLVLSAILGGLGLLWFSYADDIVVTFIAATVFAVGVCYFWPTMLGTVAERVPKGGALALALMGGTGMAVVGLVTSPQMGRVADTYVHERLAEEKTETVAVLTKVSATYTPLLAAPPKGVTKQDLKGALSTVNDVIAALPQTDANDLPSGTANALRAAVGNGPPLGTEKPAEKPAAEAKDEAQNLLNPADNYGGKMSFRYVAPFSIVLVVIFGILYAMDRAKGGYKAEKIVEEGMAEMSADNVPPAEVQEPTEKPENTEQSEPTGSSDESGPAEQKDQS